jgi:hypothetical protein
MAQVNPAFAGRLDLVHRWSLSIARERMKRGHLGPLPRRRRAAAQKGPTRKDSELGTLEHVTEQAGYQLRFRYGSRRIHFSVCRGPPVAPAVVRVVGLVSVLSARK